MQVPELPLDVLSQIAALVSPPYHPPSEYDAPDSPTPPPFVLDALDPHPPNLPYPNNTLSALSKASHRLLEASRPWLWEEVDVRSGGGWLAVVNALTEEVPGSGERTPMEITMKRKYPSSLGKRTPVTPLSPAIPAADAHVTPNTIPGGTNHYSPNPTAFPFPYTPPNSTPSQSSALGVQFPASPPQPSHAALLLTPPGSRGTSPNPAFQPIIYEASMALQRAGSSSQGSESDERPYESQREHSSSGEHGAQLSRCNTIATSAPNSNSKPGILSTPHSRKLRGRSRSPHGRVGFDTASISGVIERSRSASAHRSPDDRTPRDGWPRRVTLERRRSSLSRSRVRSQYDCDDEKGATDEEDEEDDIITPMSPPKTYTMPTRIPAVQPLTEQPAEEEEAFENVNPELLPTPGPYIRHLSFNNFRTIGSRRTLDEAVRGRYVTGGRLEGVIKNCPNMITLCMTEYVDSALSFPVLEDVLFRGYRKPRSPRRFSTGNHLTRQRSLSIDAQLFESPTTALSQLDPPRPDYVPYEDETEAEKWNRRSMFTALQGLDLTGCVSQVFTSAMREFFVEWLDPEFYDETDLEDRGRSRHRYIDAPSSTEDEDDAVSEFHIRRRPLKRTPRFTAMRRLSLRACTTLDPPLLHHLVLSFPNLTHLDLSNTRVPSSVLVSLTESPPRAMRLQSLSLARCPRLDSHAIVDFLVLSSATRDLTELNLYMNPTQTQPLTPLDVDRLLTAPCIKSGKLRYLDLSSACISKHHLQPGVFPPQPSLLSLGLSHIPHLPLPPIANFLADLAPNVEVLSISGTGVAQLNPRGTSIQTTLELHAYLINPLTRVPFSLASLSLNGGSSGPDLRPGATRLRVVELSGPIRRLIADGGAGEWKVVKSKGGRGWYVDTSAGWIPDLDPNPETGEPAREGKRKFVRHLPSSHPRRQWLSSLAEAGGRVGSAVGWHSRKMEIVRGMGMLGREEGMAGVGGFAFEE